MIEKDEKKEEKINIRNIVNVVIRRKRLFLYIAIPVFLGIIVSQLLRPYTPIYRATFDIGIMEERPVEGFFNQYQEGTVSQIGAVTQRVISSLLSTSLAAKVVDSLRLQTHFENGSVPFDIDVRYNQVIDQQIGPLKVSIADSRVRISQNGNVRAEGRVGEYIDLGPIELAVSAPKDLPYGKSSVLVIYPRDRMALALRNSLAIKVLEAGQIEQEAAGTGIPFSGENVSKKLVTATSIFPGMNLVGILRIHVHWGNPQDALSIANALAAQTIAEDIDAKSLRFVQSQTFIDSQLTVYQARLISLEETIRKFKEGKQIADLQASTQALIDQISRLESRKNQLQIEQKMLRDLSQYLAQEQEEIDNMPGFASVVVADPVLQNFYADLLDAAAELRGRLKEYAAGHPKVLEVRARLDGIKDQLRVETEKRTSTIKTEIGSVDGQIMVLQAKLSNVPDDEIQLARLERDKETAEKLYTFFAEKLEETRVQEAGVTSDLRLINPPLVSSKPSNSRRLLLTGFLAFVVGIVVASFVIFVVEYIDTNVRDPDILSSKIGLPIFASIPVIGNEESGNEKKMSLAARFTSMRGQIKRPGKKSDSKVRILDGDISTPEFEAFRKLSTNIDFAHPEKEYRVIYVSSSGPEEGKTFIALNYGVALAVMSKKVVLLDTDFRKKKGNLTDIAKKRKATGLFDVLEDRASLADVMTTMNLIELHQRSGTGRTAKPPGDVEKSALANATLELLPVGGIPPNPFVFLESDKMQRLVRQLKVQYDYVIVDGVPVLLFADASYLSNFADGVLLTARYGRTGINELEMTKEILLSARSRIIGIVMNGVPTERGSYYYHYHHKYYSKYYSKGA